MKRETLDDAKSTSVEFDRQDEDNAFGSATENEIITE
jgi:hypothetical protein